MVPFKKMRASKIRVSIYKKLGLIELCPSSKQIATRMKFVSIRS